MEDGGGIGHQFEELGRKLGQETEQLQAPGELLAFECDDDDAEDLDDNDSFGKLHLCGQCAHATPFEALADLTDAYPHDRRLSVFLYDGAQIPEILQPWHQFSLHSDPSLPFALVIADQVLRLLSADFEPCAFQGTPKKLQPLFYFATVLTHEHNVVVPLI